MGNNVSYCPYDNPNSEELENKKRKVKICNLHNGVKFCDYNSCKTLIRDQSIFCPEHKCNYDKCQNLKYNKLPLCYDHYKLIACHIKGCNNSKLSESNYCSYHNCSMNNCKNKILSQSDFCLNHTCSIPNCSERIHGNSSLCFVHRFNNTFAK